ncbi:MAG: glutaredoxin [Comamonadaceae bacterium]|nr:MAG: glutaredoxin [Comamonadaceae bacterium]
MPRPILEEAQIHSAIRAKVAGWQQSIVEEVRAASQAHDVLVVGMGVNPWPAKARKALEAIHQPYHYLEYGSYFGEWRRRSALKMWTGWPTFPMVFVRGVLVGGFTELQALISSDELSRMLNIRR